MGDVAGLAFIYYNVSDFIFPTGFWILKSEGHFGKTKKGMEEPHRVEKAIAIFLGFEGACEHSNVKSNFFHMKCC